jgi:hypothetical protein
MTRKSSISLRPWLSLVLWAAGWGLWLQLGSVSALAAPRYFLKVREVEFAPGVAQAAAIAPRPQPAPSPTGSTPAAEPGQAGAATATPPTPPAAGAAAKGPAQLARDLLSEALRKRPEVTLELEASLDNPEAVKAECKRKGLKPYEVNLRVLRMDRSVKPPPPGKKFRMLEQNVKLSLVGVTFPEKMLALGGDGESTVQIEVGQDVSATQEQEVLEEALKDAIEQAVKQGLAKLSMPLSKPQKDPPRRKK